MADEREQADARAMPDRPAGRSIARHRGPEWIGGAVLIFIGAVLLIGREVQDLGRYIPLIIGVGLLGLFLVTRAYGALVPGGIVTGVGAGIVLDDQPGAPAGVFLVALGLGFVSIWLIGLLFRLRENHWWPIIPGGILLLVGGAEYAGTQGRQALELFELLWPVLLIAIGLLVVIRAFLGRDRTADAVDDARGSTGED